MLAIDDLVWDYGDPQVEPSNKDRLWALLAEKIAPAGFLAIDILRIEVGFFLFTNECRVAPSNTELGLSELFDPGTQSPDIQQVAFEGGSAKGLKLTLWQSTDTAIRRPDRGEITVTSACFSPHFDRVPGLGFILYGHKCDSVHDPMNELLDLKLCSLPPYDPHKQRPRSAWQDSPW
jgi:glycine cleavage system aminomethyltransferase T